MKYKEKILEYARQYQTIGVKEWRKVVFSNENIFNLDGPNVFRSTGPQKIFQKGITQPGIV